MRPGRWLLIALVVFAFAPGADADDFTIVIFGDTQTYTDTPDPALGAVFEHMIDYVIAQKASDNIALVLQVGDAIEEGNGDVVTPGTTAEWGRFNTQWQRLDGVVPYAVTRGNHDNTQEFSLHYGSSALSSFSHYQGTHPAEDDDAHAWRVDLGGEDALVLGISCNPSASELSWAQGVLDADPDQPAIVMSHIMTTSAGFHTVSASFAGEAACNGNPLVSVWDELVTPNADQVFMTASGHFIHPSHGSKSMRETEGSIVLDTFQNWQGAASADGCMALVRFRPAAREVEVEAWCTELNAGAGAFLDAPGETTLPTVTVDGCLGFSLLDAFGPGVCVPLPLPPPAALNPTISFNDDALVPNSLLFRAITVSAASLLNLSNFEVLDATEITGALLLEADELFLSAAEDMDAAHVRLDGQVIFSTITDVYIDGVRFRPGDLIRYDPVTGLSSLYFDGELFTTDTENIDAVYLFEEGVHAGKLLLSTSAIASLGGLVDFLPGDLVLYDPALDTATLYFSESLLTGTAAQKNIDALHVQPDGNLLLSVLIDNGTLGGLVLKDEDIVEYDPVADVATVFISGAGLFNGTTANLNALTFASRVPVLAPTLSPRGWALLVLALVLPSLLVLRRDGPRV